MEETDGIFELVEKKASACIHFLESAERSVDGRANVFHTVIDLDGFGVNGANELGGSLAQRQESGSCLCKTIHSMNLALRSDGCLVRSYELDALLRRACKLDLLSTSSRPDGCILTASVLINEGIGGGVTRMLTVTVIDDAFKLSRGLRVINRREKLLMKRSVKVVTTIDRRGG